MSPLARKFRFGSSVWFIALVCLTFGSMARLATALPAHPVEGSGQEATTRPVSDDDMAHMAGHMYLTALRPLQPGDRQKADAIVVQLQGQAMEPYRDYQKALSDGYKIFLPDVPQPQYHFTN